MKSLSVVHFVAKPFLDKTNWKTTLEQFTKKKNHFHANCVPTQLLTPARWKNTWEFIPMIDLISKYKIKSIVNIVNFVSCHAYLSFCLIHSKTFRVVFRNIYVLPLYYRWCFYAQKSILVWYLYMLCCLLWFLNIQISRDYLFFSHTNINIEI